MSAESSEDDEEPLLKFDYKLCCLYNSEKKECGPCTKYRTTRYGLVLVENLNSDIVNYLRNLHFKKSDDLLLWNERKLIESRVGHELQSESSICEYHRDKHGLGWYQTLHCAHPDHPPFKLPGKTKKTTPAPMWLVKSLNNEKPCSFPIGGRVCRQHTPVAPKPKPKKNDMADDAVGEDDATEEPTEEDSADVSFVLEQIIVATDVQANSIEKGQQFAQLLQVSPMPFQVTETPVEEIGQSSKSVLRRKLLQVRDEAVRNFAECIAPTQGDKLIKELFPEDPEDDATEEEIPSDLVPLIGAYKNSTDKQARLVILSLVDHKMHTKTNIQIFFNCSRYAVDTARKLRVMTQGLTLPKQIKFRRNRLNIQKAEHFIEFLFASGLVQDVAYGVSKIKFDSGSVQTIPHAILTTKYSHAIAFYLEICKNCNYQPLSERTLWRILTQIKPSKRKCLAGLDDITAAGMNGFSYLEKFLSDRKRYKELSDKLEKGKRYLKTNFQSHCSPDSDICSHNTTYALSDAKEEPCTNVGSSVCSECFNLVSTLGKILSIAETEGTDEIIYDVNASINAIFAYMNHQIRDVQQRRAKSYCFNHLGHETAFWLKDFAQKLLPMRFREGQREYFGKKGMSIHIDVFFRKQGEDLLKYVYLTCLFRCNQNSVDVLNIGDNVLCSFKVDCPMISKLFAKSDNASCYHGNFIYEALFKLCKSRSLQLLRYDFNEPCKGKDQCDRESAGAKTVINSYVDNGNDVINAVGAYDALHYGRGIKNTKVAVIESNVEEASLTGAKIKNISAYHSIKFSEDHMKLYRYYDIGPGVKVSFKPDHAVTTSYDVVREFHHTQNEPSIENHPQKKKKRSDHTSCSFIFCENALCTDVFESQQEYEVHLLSEKHSFAKQETSMDSIKASYVEKIKASSHLHSTCMTSAATTLEIELSHAEAEAPLMKRISEQGWALPHRINFNFSYEQKILLLEIFTEGERSGIKKSPEEVEDIIRRKMKLSQWVTSIQIARHFSALTKKLKDGTLKDYADKLSEKRSGVKNVDEEDEADEPVNPDVYARSSDDDPRIDIVQETHEILNNILEYEIGDYVAVRKHQSWCPGKIIDIFEELYEVSLMECTDKVEMKNEFRWPTAKREEEFSTTDLFLRIEEPIQVTKSKRSTHYYLADDDYNVATELLQILLN